MKRYRFRLETVLRVRRLQQDEAKGQLLFANSQVAMAKAVSAARSDKYSEGANAMGILSATTFRQLLGMRQATAATLRGGEKAVEDAQATADVQRAVWADAARKVKTLERLDERRREEHRVESDRKEAAEVDDLVVSRYVRPAS